MHIPHPFLAGGKVGLGCCFLAGIGCSVLEWQNNIAALAARHRVYAFDMLGQGLTDKPQKNCYAIADLARFTLAFLSAQGEASAHFIGNSLGGRIALECARLAPARVKSMVLAAPAGLGRETALTMRLASLPVLGNLLTRPSRIGTRMLWSPAFHDPSFVTEGFMRTIHQPTLVPPDHARILEAKLPQSRTILFDECGHLPQLEQQGQFNAAVLDFLSGEDNRAL
jgi:pimeloyl-ACP methyl ester carboxylesterase